MDIFELCCEQYPVSVLHPCFEFVSRSKCLLNSIPIKKFIHRERYSDLVPQSAHSPSETLHCLHNDTETNIVDSSDTISIPLNDGYSDHIMISSPSHPSSNAANTSNSFYGSTSPTTSSCIPSSTNASSVLPARTLLNLQNCVSFMSPLTEAARLLCDRSVPSVIVLGDDTQEALAILTRSDITNFLKLNQTLLEPEILRKMIRHCNIDFYPTNGTSNVDDTKSHEVNITEVVSELVMNIWNKSHGKVVYHGKNHLEKLLSMIDQLMSVVLEEKKRQKDNRWWIDHMVSVYEEDTLDKTLELLHDRSTKRLFVCDKARNIRGEITSHNLLSQFFIPPC